ncbi:metalloregulator ArsR/SmtB family transcription factor [Fictibacillus sp. b24]|uniref:metalloregulator ArsR/SmtB family transcription factor n=1 Tax=Fictibacillus sp. b24 TaxID=3055863 RepID=UPI0025A01B17|nr:metalloregulator ArsR/SmtB family transcription factor [Fictibacillus sp. b24]MDM5316171.1 metalloregulator ArsR/SmtB family transcription factor [Fictibacillus sp. b24]
MVNEDLVEVFKALSHPIRIGILDHLKSQPLTTGELSEKYDVSRYAIMKHLGVLVDVNLVLVRRKGRLRVNYLNVIPLQELYSRWVSKYEAMHANSLLTIKKLVEEKEGNKMEQTKEIKIDSFQIEQDIVLHGKVETVFKALTEDIGSWWHFRVGDKGAQLIFEPQLGGRFYEDWGNGEGALWGTVTYFKRNDEIRLNGLLGMSGAVNSSYSYKLIEDGDKTILQLSHQAVGILEPHWEEAHRHGWNELLQENLKKFIEQK